MTSLNTLNTTPENVRARSWEERVQNTADMLGMIPVLNVPAEIVSGLISLRRRDYVGVALSVAGLVPVQGEWAVVMKAARNAQHLGHAAKVGSKLAQIAHNWAEQEVARSAA